MDRINPNEIHLLYPRPTKLLLLLSVCLSVRPSVGDKVFRSVTKVCFRISIWNFICILLVAMGRSLLVFSDVTFKMADRRPSWISRFPDSKYSLALNINSKLQCYFTCVYGKEPIDFQYCHFQNGSLAAILDISVTGLSLLFGFEYQVQTSEAHY